MKKSEFPEKAFETFFNHELLSRGFKIYLPSQRKEDSLGYDVLMNELKKGRGVKAIALQYKVVSKYNISPVGFNKPCFKFDLHKSSNRYKQHNILVARNNRKSSKVSAFYCVPSFVEYQSLYDFLIEGTLFKHSCAIKPCYRINDSRYHYIAFDDMRAGQFSKLPQYIPICNFESIFYQEEPLYYQDWISEIDSNEQQEALCYRNVDSRNDYNQIDFKQELDEFLRSTHSFLVYRFIDE